MTQLSIAGQGPDRQEFRGGFLNIDKPVGVTSADVVRRVKRATGIGKVGHGGTLDPAASGVLPVCLGTATRLSDSLLLGAKAYRVAVHLGSATDTYDSEGKVLRKADASHITREDVLAALPRFTGAFSQRPPAFSALKIGGRRAYELARAGARLEMAPREVMVFGTSLARWAPPIFELDVECGHGFYARSLANDLGEAMGIPSHLSGLVRTRTGPFAIEEAVTLEVFLESVRAGSWKKHLYPVDWSVMGLPAIVLNETDLEHVVHGREISLPLRASRITQQGPTGVRAYDFEGRLVAIMAPGSAAGSLRPAKVLY